MSEHRARSDRDLNSKVQKERVGAKGIAVWPRHLGEQVVAAALVVVASIPLAVTATIVWLDLGRPLTFVQERVGLNLRPFKIYKLRTMRDLRDGAGMPLPDSMRVTPLSRYLRRTRVDELLQLIAIVRGEMSFIGPRPLLPTTIENLGDLGKLRCSVRPGLTGWAQVNGNALLSDSEKLALDIWYIAHRSYLQDALIILKTITMVIFGEKVHRENLSEAQEYINRIGKELNSLEARL